MKAEPFHLVTSRLNQAADRARYIPASAVISLLVRAVIVVVVFRINIQ